MLRAGQADKFGPALSDYSAAAHAQQIRGLKEYLSKLPGFGFAVFVVLNHPQQKERVRIIGPLRHHLPRQWIQDLLKPLRLVPKPAPKRPKKPARPWRSRKPTSRLKRRLKANRRKRKTKSNFRVGSLRVGR